MAKDFQAKFNCEQQDKDHMVQCDMCDTWYHFNCGGVTESIEDFDWCCKSCQKTQRAHVASSSAKSAKALSHHLAGSSSSSKKKLRLELKRLEEENFQRERRESAERKAEREQALAEEAAGREQALAEAKAARKAAQAEEAAERDKRMLETEKQDKEYLEAKYKLIELESEFDDSDEGNNSQLREKRAESWVEQHNEIQMKETLKVHNYLPQPPVQHPHPPSVPQPLAYQHNQDPLFTLQQLAPVSPW